MIVYLDTNVVLDYLLARPPYGMEAAELLTLTRRHDVQVFIAPNAIIMGFALLRQQPLRMDPTSIKHSLALFRKLVSCVSVTNAAIDEALARLNAPDLEDSLQIVLAQKCNADIIVTNDRRGFRTSPIQVMTTKEFLLNWSFT